MSTGKTYGRDGPPQLRGRAEDVPADVLNEWVAAGAYWLRPTRVRAADVWEKRVHCACGRHDAFEILTADSDQLGWVSGEHFTGNFRCDLRCGSCASEFVLFDDGLHGWNAVICDERSNLPAEYLESNRGVLKPLICACGARQFSVIAGATYDCGDNLADLPESQWDDAYGSFSAQAKCASCGKIHGIVDAETA